MQVVELNRFGGPEVLQLGQRRRPEPGPRQVLIRNAAVAINPIDCKIRGGRLRPLLWPRLPAVLGYDFCGQVAELGPEVTGLAAWDWVLGMSDQRYGGCYAEYVLVGAEAVCPRPPALSTEQAAALPLCGLAALQALRDLGRIEAGHRVMIIGAAGGVGHLAVQLARLLGARVTAVCSGANAEWVASLGAGQVIDYQRENLGSNGAPYDVVLDTVCNQPFVRLWPLLAPEGVYVGLRVRPDRLYYSARLRFGTGQRIRTLQVKPDKLDLALLAGWADEGRLKPRISETFGFTELGSAHQRAELGHVRGKLVARLDQA